jgi:hypothetical protein
MTGVDSPRDIYRVSLIMRGNPAAVLHTKADLLNALYIGAGAIPSDPFYAPIWSALEAHIKQLEDDRG